MRLFGNVMRNIAETAAVPPKGVWRFLGRDIRGWLFFDFEWGKPDGKEKGQYMPPLHCRLAAMGRKLRGLGWA
jgi:hypothetical protein